MTPEMLLAQLRALIERIPDFESYSANSKEHRIWLAQAHALISRWDKFAAAELKNAADFLFMDLTRDQNVAKILGTIDRAIADLELSYPSQTQLTFAGGEVYDFFRALGGIVASAESFIFIVDPYLDDSVMDHYISRRGDNVSIKLLLNQYADGVRVAAEKYNSQHGPILEARKSSKLHDRIIFVDQLSCWMMGQSLKDAAKAKPTYIVPLPPDVVPDKLRLYEKIWEDADDL